jgi:hypothetical protein
MMSLEWGKFRDEYDALKQEMADKQKAFDDLMKEFKAQLADIVHQKTVHIEAIAAVVSQVNIIQESVDEKNEERKQLTNEWNQQYLGEYTKTLSHIGYNQICAVRMIRNALMSCSTKSPPSNISDCDVTDWVGDRCEDSQGNDLECDNSCPQPNPFDCGGIQTITRDIVVAPNDFGLKCPELTRQRKCHQYKCPVNCALSDWSGWGKCSAECNSGVQTETRSVLVKPIHGGEACDALDDTQSCNTFSCDRDCSLEDWTAWSSCSMSCSMEGYKGSQTRIRKVKVAKRAGGDCPEEPTDSRWYEVQACNTHECAGDEICIAKMDLILAIDASGSLKKEGFETLKTFATNLTARYRGQYFGMQDMKIGIALFGQGKIVNLPNGQTTITPAKNMLALTDDMDKVKKKIEELPYQGGFTNMAQAIALSDVMLSQGGREDAQSAIMVISDGKYSMEYQTEQEINRTKAKNTMIFMLPVTESEDDQVQELKSWASIPSETNFERIPGIESLMYNSELFAQRIVSKFCPASMSPSQMRMKEQQQEYMLVRKNGWPSNKCGKWYYLGKLGSKDDCAKEARKKGKTAFSFGRSFAKNRCYAESMDITMERWNMYSANRKNPPCPNGRWLWNPFFDTYIMYPLL